jgi:hypothetical protein
MLRAIHTLTPELQLSLMGSHPSKLPEKVLEQESTERGDRGADKTELKL